MKQLPKWLINYRELLQKAFREREFSRSEAVSVLRVPMNTADDILSTLIRSGYLFKIKQVIDQRESIYRLVNTETAQALHERLTQQQKEVQITPSLPNVIDVLWDYVRGVMGKQLDLGDVPSTQLSALVAGYVDGETKFAELKVIKKINLKELDKKERDYAVEVFKIFDASSNAYRSITNVWLEYLKLTRDLEKGNYDLNLAEYAAVNGIPLQFVSTIANKALCPICGRFKQAHNALAMITGNPKTDSRFQTYRNSKNLKSKRLSMKICHFCFTAGWVDLPTTKIVKEGQSINKEREYLFITSPLSEERLKRLLDSIVDHGNRPKLNLAESKEFEGTDQENIPVLDSLTLELCHEFDVELTDSLAILGLSTRRLRELRGFVLQSANQLQRTIVLRIPIEGMSSITGENKVSGAVRQELMKAIMYDFWQVTGGSLHYGRIHPNKQFSVGGQAVELDAMFRANCAYRIADRYARVGKYRHLNSSLFMLLLTHSRQAANRILNAEKRRNGGKYAPNNKEMKEIIHMVEEIVKEKDWQFQLGLKIVDTLVNAGLTKRAKSFWKREGGKYKTYSGVDLIKWIQRIKMIHDPNTARAWGTSLINGYRREHDGDGANTKIVGSILTLVEEIISTCEKHNTPLVEFSRTIANMDYYLLFYYNHNQIEEKEN